MGHIIVLYFVIKFLRGTRYICDESHCTNGTFDTILVYSMSSKLVQSCQFWLWHYLLAGIPKYEFHTIRLYVLDRMSTIYGRSKVLDHILLSYGSS